MIFRDFQDTYAFAVQIGSKGRSDGEMHLESPYHQKAVFAANEGNER